MQPSTELKDLMLRWYASFAAGDFALIERILTRQPGLTFIGTDPVEWLMGYEAIAHGFQVQTAGMSGIQIEASADLAAYSDGNVGWVADRPLIKLPDGATFSMRSTLVFQRQAGEWKLVQQHNSVGVPNEELVGKTLPL
jgi:ketosteroid isomerase-like protein